MLTAQEVREAYGELVADKSDAALQRACDRLGDTLAGLLGHGFGAALRLWAEGEADATVEVWGGEVVLGSRTIDLVYFPTLGQLAEVIRAHGYAVDLLVDPATPSALLRQHGEVVCGPAYDRRVVLWATAHWTRLRPSGQTLLFLPYPLVEVASVTAGGAPVAYAARPGESWLERRPFGARWDSVACRDGDYEVVYTPRYWGSVPAEVTAALLEAFGAQQGVAPLEAENFGGGAYSYRRGGAPAIAWQQTLGNLARRYGARYHP